DTLFSAILAVLDTALGPGPPLVGRVLSNLAVLDAAAGRPDDALRRMERAAAIDDRAIGEVFSLGSENQRADFLRGIQAHLTGFLWLVLEHRRDSDGAVRSAFDLVLRRKGLGAEALAVQRDALPGGRYPELQPPLGESAALKRKIARLALDGPRSQEPGEYRIQLGRWHAEKERLEAELAQHIPELRLAQQFRAANAESVAAAFD